MGVKQGDRSPWADELFECAEHGEHTGLVCVLCYRVQQERIELESVPLRYANTSEKQRAWVLAELAKGNGH